MRFTHRADEAERFYSRAIEVRRDLLRGRGCDAADDDRPVLDITRARDDANLLLVHGPGDGLVARSGGPLGASRASAAWNWKTISPWWPPDSRRRSLQVQLKEWARQLMLEKGAFPTPSQHRTDLLYSRLATILNPANANAHNQIAWALVSVPDDPWFDPKRGLEEAGKAVKLESEQLDLLEHSGCRGIPSPRLENRRRLVQEVDRYRRRRRPRLVLPGDDSLERRES